jgi:hypothetical protein
LHGEASLSRAQLPGRSASFGRTTPANKLLLVTSLRRPSLVTPFDSGKQAGYCGASARIKFDDEHFAALFNELLARGRQEQTDAALWSLTLVARFVL